MCRENSEYDRDDDDDSLRCEYVQCRDRNKISHIRQTKTFAYYYYFCRYIYIKCYISLHVPGQGKNNNLRYSFIVAKKNVYKGLGCLA